VIDTFVSLLRMFGDRPFDRVLMQAVADGARSRRRWAAARRRALRPELGGAPNPSAGRRPDGTIPIWAGGSSAARWARLVRSADPEMRAAVLDVPGAGWTGFIPGSMV
jgi:hypothetical protein